MAFKATQWKYSDQEDQTQISVEEGVNYLYITGARYDEDKGIYTVEVESLNNRSQFRLTYFLENRNENNQPIINPNAKGTLISLGKALAGVTIGIPNPPDIVGGVVKGYVYLKESQKGNVYPKVYHFDPVPEEMAVLATIDQYFVGAEEEAQE